MRSSILILIPLAAISALVGCASTGPPLPPSLELPKPPSDLRAVRKGDSVTLSWTVPALTTDRQSVRYLGPTRICRTVTAPLSHCDSPVGETVPPAPDTLTLQASGHKVAQDYIDVLPASLTGANPQAVATYAVEVYNRGNHGAGISNQVRVPLAPTLPAPADFKAEVSAEGVILTWQGPAPGLIVPQLGYRYRIYRRPSGSAKDVIAGEVPLESPGPFRFVDHGFEWQNTYVYRITAVTVSTSFQPCPHASPTGADCMATVEIEGDDSPPVEIDARDVFPAVVPGGLEAAFSGSGQQPFIDLVWSPAVEADLSGYNIYRHEDAQPPVRINAEPVKTPAFRDSDVQPGKKYFYSVTAVDLRGNESARSEEASEQVPQ